MATDRPRYTVSVDDELFKKIEDYRFKNRFATRSEATVELLKLGLLALEEQLGQQKDQQQKQEKHED